jgi:hypothetical protein
LEIWQIKNFQRESIDFFSIPIKFSLDIERGGDAYESFLKEGKLGSRLFPRQKAGETDRGGK